MTGRRKSGRGDQTVILIADDEVLIRNVARIVLEKEGYFTLACQDGEDALRISRKFPGTIHAVLSDVKMPNVNGMELREQILAERPGIKVLLMSGQTDAPLPANVAFLAKPFGPDYLRDRMRQLLASPASVQSELSNCRRGYERYHRSSLVNCAPRRFGKSIGAQPTSPLDPLNFSCAKGPC